MLLLTFLTLLSVGGATPAQTADGDPTRGSGCGATIVHPHHVVVY
jgi:hypothetical protein